MIFLKFGNSNQVIQNLIPKFRQSSIISEKPDYLSDYLSIYLQPPQNLIFFGKILKHVLHLTMSTKGCLGFFLFCLDLELLIKM